MTDTPDIPTLDMALCANVYALNLAFGRFYQTAFGDSGFSYPKLVVLLALSEGAPMSLSDLSARVGTEPNTLSPLVKKMSQFGLIGRQRDEQDERRVLMTLLEPGREMLEEANKVMQEGSDALGLDHADVHAAIAVLGRIRNKLEQVTPETGFTVPESIRSQN